MTINVAAFHSRFPAFDGIEDGPIQTLLDMATHYIDADVWSANDYELAIMLWSAHMLQMTQTQATISEINGAGSSDLFVRMVRYEGKLIAFGTRTGMSKVDDSAGPGEAQLGLTIYGQQFLMLRIKNVPSVAIV